MWSFYEILCTHCNFKIINGGVDNFYIDCKTNELVEYFQGMIFIERDGDIFGHIKRTYCPKCNKLIKTYIITKSEYSKEESIHKLKKKLNNSNIEEKKNIDLLMEIQKDHNEILRISNKEEELFNNEFLEKFKTNNNILTKVQFEKDLDICDFETIEEYDEYEKRKEDCKITCPQCGEMVYRSFHIGKCPICENKLTFGIRAMLD